MPLRFLVEMAPGIFPESEGCLVVPAVFKTDAGPFCGPGQVRFLSSPPLFPSPLPDEQVKPARLRSIPAVDAVVRALGSVDLPRPALVSVVRRELARLRNEAVIPEPEAVVQQVRGAVNQLLAQKLRPVINGTGILLNTNLGRAPLGPATRASLHAMTEEYCNLEIDLAEGTRGSRAGYLEHNLALLCGGEAAMVVNNGAAALVLIVRHFTAKKPEVVISRGELVQIGGGFRVPEILEASGARLREVGTTNQTTLEDYARALGPETGMILKVHRSNFFMGGFVQSPTTGEIARLARSKRLPFAEDLGSGAVIATEKIAGLEHEPTAAEVLGSGADLVCFSGDKLLGGPQAGIIAGRQRAISALKREPFYRALRCGKLVLTALQSTVDQCLAGEAGALPVVSMLQSSRESLVARAEKIVAALADQPLRATVGHGTGQVGGGTLPRSAVSSVTVDIVPAVLPLEAFSKRLRLGEVAVVGNITKNHFKIDLRTVFPRHDSALIHALILAVADRDAANHESLRPSDNL